MANLNVCLLLKVGVKIEIVGNDIYIYIFIDKNL